MDKIKQKVILNANGATIAVLHFGDDNDYLSLTDIAKFKNPDDALLWLIIGLEVRIQSFLLAFGNN
jgi:hypothetical protein